MHLHRACARKLETSHKVSVDSFRKYRPEVSYFLTHDHSDHTDGLSSKWRGTIVCTRATADILSVRLPSVRTKVVECDDGQWHRIRNDLECSLISCDHLLGSCMVLLRFRRKEVHVYTGDLVVSSTWLRRAKETINRLGARRPKRAYIDAMYLNYAQRRLPSWDDTASLVRDWALDHTGGELPAVIDTSSMVSSMLHSRGVPFCLSSEMSKSPHGKALKRDGCCKKTALVKIYQTGESVPYGVPVVRATSAWYMCRDHLNKYEVHPDPDTGEDRVFLTTHSDAEQLEKFITWLRPSERQECSRFEKSSCQRRTQKRGKAVVRKFEGSSTSRRHKR